MKGQLQRLGISYAWGRELATCLPDYYRWNQWLFTRMFERGLAYRRRSTVNWCPSCNTVLANEQVIDGACWRCGTQVIQKDLEQWFFKITAYAEDLLLSAEGLAKWPEKVLTMQRNWIGRSEGARVRFPIQGANDSIEVFTTRIDTIFGATFMMLAPEHGLVTTFAKESEDEKAFLEKAQRFRAQDRAGRLTGEVAKEGFFTGRFAINPYTNKPIPIWVANYVLGEYGTGAVMGVPAHDERDFEFAREVRPADRAGGTSGRRRRRRRRARSGADVERRHPDQLGQVRRHEVATRRSAAITEDAEERGIGQGTVQFRLKDWGISRQRYWGTPIPMIHCPVDGIVPVPDDQLPVELPKVTEFTGRGDSPLASVPEFVNVTCPNVRRAGPARDRHDGYVRRFVVVLLPLRRRAQRPAAVRSEEGRVLVPGGFLQRRHRTRHPALDLFAILRARVSRPRDGRTQGAVHAPADARHGVEGRRGDVEVQGQRGRSGLDDGEVRVGRAASVCDVRGAAGEGGRVDRYRAGRQLPVPGPGVARGRSMAG